MTKLHQVSHTPEVKKKSEKETSIANVKTELMSENFMALSIFSCIDRKCPYLIYSLEVMLVWLACVLASQPLLIFLILFLKHGRSSKHLQSRTTIGRKTATINEGGVYQMNWLASTHLFQANTSAWTVHSSRAKYPILLWKEKENCKLFIFPKLAKKYSVKQIWKSGQALTNMLKSKKRDHCL